MAFRASLSQRRWESHQPQEECHSRHRPHLQITQQNSASPSRRDPASSEVLGGEVLVPAPNGSGRRDSGARGRGRQGPLLSRPAPAAPGVASRRVAQDGSEAPRTRRCFELGSRCSPAPAFIRLFPIGRRRSFPPLPQRLPCGDGDALTDGAPGGRRAAPQALGCVRVALGSWAANSSGPELLALGAALGALPRVCPRGARRPRPQRSRAPGTTTGLRSGSLDAFVLASLPQPHFPDKLSQRKRTLLRFSATSPLRSSIELTEDTAARSSDQLFLLSTREHLFPGCSGKGQQRATFGFRLRSTCSCLLRRTALKKLPGLVCLFFFFFFNAYTVRPFRRFYSLPKGCFPADNICLLSCVVHDITGPWCCRQKDPW